MTAKTGKTPIGVGIIGANPDRGWAATAHIPALAALDQFSLRALSTSRRESARQAAEQFGITDAFDNHADLVTHPDVDLVVVAVKVPHHYELVTAALEAGKHVLCEWPLGNGLEEAETMAALARKQGVRGFVGLQARASPAVAYVRDLVAEGYIGDLLSTTLVASGMAWGGAIDSANAYVNDHRNGASLLTIPFGHAVDALCWCLGDIDALSATMATRRPRIQVVDSGETLDRTVADELAVSGILEGGALAAVHYRGSPSPGDNLLWRINGSKGELMLRADHGHLQIATPALTGAGEGDEAFTELAIPERYRPAPAAPAGPAWNVAQAYSRLAEDLTTGSATLPTFDDAVANHRLLARVEVAAGTGPSGLQRT